MKKLTDPPIQAQTASGSVRWLLLRRLVQLSVMLLFLALPWWGVTWVKGNLASSTLLDTVALSDPYLFVQTLATGYWPAASAIIGTLTVVGFYVLLGGRTYCAWVCPMNWVTDCAAWLRRKLGLKAGRAPDPKSRYWVLAGSLLAAAISGTLVWEWVNPVSVLQRSLIFGLSGAWGTVLAVFIYDLLIATRGWCGHLCPVGAFYSLLGPGLVSVSAAKRAACDDCMDCFQVCPEPHVIRPALKKVGQESPLIVDRNCTHCGRCIDVCNKHVFRFTHRFDQRSDS